MEKEKIPFEEYLSLARRISAQGCEGEKYNVSRESSPWGVYNTPFVSDNPRVVPYETIFKGLLPDNSFYRCMSERKKRTGSFFGLDVMGQGGFSDVMHVDGDVGITLVDFRPLSIREKETQQKKKHIIEGDILQDDVWQKAGSFITENDPRQKKGYDIITCRPVEGWDFVLPDAKEDMFMRLGSNQFRLYNLLVEKMVTLLHPDGGMLLVENNRLIGNPDDIINTIKDKRENFDVTLQRRIMRITKNAA